MQSSFRVKRRTGARSVCPLHFEARQQHHLLQLHSCICSRCKQATSICKEQLQGRLTDAVSQCFMQASTIYAAYGKKQSAAAKEGQG